MESIKKFENMRIENMSKINGGGNGEKQKTTLLDGRVVKDRVNGDTVTTNVGFLSGRNDTGETSGGN